MICGSYSRFGKGVIILCKFEFDDVVCWKFCVFVNED